MAENKKHRPNYSLRENPLGKVKRKDHPTCPESDKEVKPCPSLWAHLEIAAEINAKAHPC